MGSDMPMVEFFERSHFASTSRRTCMTTTSTTHHSAWKAASEVFREESVLKQQKRSEIMRRVRDVLNNRGPISHPPHPVRVRRMGPAAGLPASASA